jgi:ferredoxin-thioredoxin reductase catalytic chain
MQKYKYCHCLLFVTPEGVPITEYLPEDHEGRQAYGIVRDPVPDKGRAMSKVLGRHQTGTATNE